MYCQIAFQKGNLQSHSVRKSPNDSVFQSVSEMLGVCGLVYFFLFQPSFLTICVCFLR